MRTFIVALIQKFIEEARNSLFLINLAITSNIRTEKNEDKPLSFTQSQMSQMSQILEDFTVFSSKKVF